MKKLQFYEKYMIKKKLSSLKTRSSLKGIQLESILLPAIPIAIALWVWFSSLAFVPVPWPDDSAFYFVAKEFFKWPPRWVMLPQAPFEPTYSIFNFNTMPFYPILIGLGRWIGLDGSFLLKFWPLSAWAMSGAWMVSVLYKKGLSFLVCILWALLFSLDPEMRWASTLIRPESCIGLIGILLVLGLTLGFPKRLEPTRFWDPVAALLAIAAYFHFNAIHLLAPVIVAYFFKPRRLLQIGAKTALYLSPWIFFVLFHWKLFVVQMTLQWSRLSVPNIWLSSFPQAIESLFQQLGNPEPWNPIIHWASLGMWLILFLAFFCAFIPALIPSIAWIGGALWLWHTKPEVWFMYYCHLAIWCFVGLLLLQIKSKTSVLILMSSFLLGITAIFGYVDVQQAIHMSSTKSWNWATYDAYIQCIDQELTLLEKKLGGDKPFRVWNPTFPDVTIELSRRHPNWEFTRTNDFSNRVDLALRHGWETEAVVVTETLNWTERNISEKAENVPEITSIWMNWEPYFLNRFLKAKTWKPHRFVCQRGRWQAFLYMVKE